MRKRRDDFSASSLRRPPDLPLAAAHADRGKGHVVQGLSLSSEDAGRATLAEREVQFRGRRRRLAHQLHRELTFRHLPQRIEDVRRELGPDDLLSAEGELG